MIKVYILLVKRPDLSQKEFSEHWQYVHGPLANRLKNLRAYVQSHVITESLEDFPSANPYSGIAEVWFDSLEEAQGISADPEYLTGLYLDEPNFLLREKTAYVFTQEHHIVPPPSTTKSDSDIKSLFLTKRACHLSVEEFQQHWLQRHAPLIPKTPGLLSYTQAHVLPELYIDEIPVFDGVAELGWPDVSTFKKAWASKDHAEEQLEDLEKFVDLENTIGMLVKPIRLI